MSRSPDNSGPPAKSARRVDLTQGNILRGIVLLSWPIVSGALLNWVVGVADIKMVGYLGANAIAAVGTSRGAIFVFMAVVFALATGTQVLIARYTGERNHDRVAGVARQAVILSVIAGAVVTPLGLYLAHPLLTALGAEGAVLDGGVAYMQAFMWGAIALMINFMISSALTGAGDTLTPLVVMVFVNAANILFDWLLIFGVGPFPELGVAGAAWAVVISRTMAAMVLLWVASSPRHAIGMTLFSGWRVDLSVWTKMFYIGVPSAIQGFTRNAAYLMVLWILNQTDDGMYAVAGYTICGQIQMVGVMIGLAFMSASMTAVGQNMGADNPGRAVKSCWTVARISAVGAALLAAFFIVSAPWLIRFFTQDPEAVRWGVTSLRIMSAALPFLTTGMAFSGGLRGAGDTMSPLYVSLICFSVVGPGLAYLLTVVLGWGPVGAWYGLSAGIMLAMFLVSWVFRRGRWKTIKL